MKVYVLMRRYEYEGDSFIAVYSTLVGLLQDCPTAVTEGAVRGNEYFYFEEELQ